MLQCVLSCRTSNMFLFLPCHLSLALCLLSCRCLSAIFAAFAALLIPALTLAKAPLSFANSFVDRLQSEVHNPLVSFLAHTLSIFFRFHSNLPWSTCVMFPPLGCRDCRHLFNDDVLQRNDELTVRHRRSSEPAVQQAFWHQFLDCEHLLLIHDLTKSVLKLVHFVCERPQGCHQTDPRLSLCPFR